MSDTIQKVRQRWGAGNARKQRADAALAEAESLMEQARREQQEAARDLPGLERDAAAAVKEQEKGVHGLIKAAEQQLHRGVELAKDTKRSSFDARKLARSWLLGGTARDDGMNLVRQLAYEDEAIGHFHGLGSTLSHSRGR